MTAAILWLTLAAKPLGDVHIPSLLGIDKVGHAGMFGLLTLAILYDFRRSLRSPLARLVAPLYATALGVLCEYMQKWMALGRSFEWDDALADAFGALAAYLLWLLLAPRLPSLPRK